MALSKPKHLFYSLAGAYFEQLYNNPVKTKALTSCIIATLANFLSQKIRGTKYVNDDSLIAFGLFGLIFGGPVPHYFYLYSRSLKHPLLILLVERLLYTPCFQALALYMIARFEGKSHKASTERLRKLFWPVFLANLKYLTLLQYINIKYVPLMLRVLIGNLIGFFWTIYLAHQCTAANNASKRGSQK